MSTVSTTFAAPLSNSSTVSTTVPVKSSSSNKKSKSKKSKVHIPNGRVITNMKRVLLKQKTNQPLRVSKSAARILTFFNEQVLSNIINDGVSLNKNSKSGGGDGSYNLNTVNTLKTTRPVYANLFGVNTKISGAHLREYIPAHVQKNARRKRRTEKKTEEATAAIATTTETVEKTKKSSSSSSSSSSKKKNDRKSSNSNSNSSKKSKASTSRKSSGKAKN